MKRRQSRPFFGLRAVLSGFALLAMAAASAAQPPSLYLADQQLDAGWRALRAGDDLEARGYPGDAFAAYNDAVGYARASMDTAQYLGIPIGGRPAAVYYLAGRGELEAALALLDLRGDWDQIYNRLESSRSALRVARELTANGPDRDTPRWASRLTDIHFNWAIASFFQNDFREARVQLQACRQLTPGHRGALDGLEAIDYIEGRRSSPITSEGTALPDRPRDGGGGDGGGGSARVGEYVGEIAKIVFGRWGNLAQMVIEDLGSFGSGER